MTLAELIYLLAHVNRTGDLLSLDEGGFPDDVHPQLLFGVTTELFFNSVGNRAKKQSAIDLAAKYFRDSDPKPDVLVQESSRHVLSTIGDIRTALALSRTDDQTIGDLAEQMTDPRRTLSFYIRNVGQGKPPRPSHVDFSTLIDGEGYRGGSFVNYQERIKKVVEETKAFVANFIDDCSRCETFYATSGLSLLFNTYAGSGPVRAYPLFQRFPGLLYADSVTFSSDVQRRNDVIRDVNWLTAISDGMFDRLGGEAAADAVLGPEIRRHPFVGGVVFQAGPLPRLGDANAADIPEAYRQIARFLKPLRFEGWTAPFYLRTPSGVDRGVATQAWITRFD